MGRPGPGVLGDRRAEGRVERQEPLEPALRAAQPVERDGVRDQRPLTRLVDVLNVPAGALVKPKDPLEYVRKLRFQQSVAGVSDYGIAPSGCAA